MIHLQQCWSWTKRMNPQAHYFTQEYQLSILCVLSLPNAQCVLVCFMIVWLQMIMNDISHALPVNSVESLYQGDYLTSQMMEFSVCIKRRIYKGPLLTLRQNFLVDHYFCSVRVTLLGECWFTQLSQMQRVTFVLITFSSELPLYWNYLNLKCAWSSPPWSWLVRKTVSFSIRKRTHSSFDMIIFNQYPHSHRVRQLVSQTPCRTFSVAPCDTSIILDVSLWESPRLERQTIISMMTGRIIVSVHAILSEMLICMQRKLTAECGQHKCETLFVVKLGGNQHSREKGRGSRLDKTDGRS